VPSAAFCQYRPGRERNSSNAVCGTPATYVAGSVKSGISIELSVSIVTDGHLHVGRHGACRLQASPMAEWATIPAPCAPPPVTVYSILCAGGGQVAQGPLSCRRRRGGIGFPPITATYYCDMQHATAELLHPPAARSAHARQRHRGGLPDGGGDVARHRGQLGTPTRPVMAPSDMSSVVKWPLTVAVAGRCMHD
jgi:hypothetical protein